MVLVDPWRLAGRKRVPRADLVLVTHGHFDHASPEDVAAVIGPGTVVAGPADALAALPGTHRALLAGVTVDLAGARVTAYPSGDGEDGFHPPSRGFAYLVEVGGLRFLHAGDAGGDLPVTDPPPDVVAVPVSGGTVLDAGGAAAAAAATGARRALPIHWGDLQGGRSDADAFAEALRGLAPGMEVLLPGASARAPSR